MTGDVNFGRNVTLRGTVIVVANEGQRIDIPDGCILENRLLSGNLNMIVRVSVLLNFSFLNTATSRTGPIIASGATFVSFTEEQEVVVAIKAKKFESSHHLSGSCR